jgi:hypothetical protein
VSNAWAIYPLHWDSHWKRWVIPGGLQVATAIRSKGGDPFGDLSAGEELESYQLVGAVTAHQGEDG